MKSPSMTGCERVSRMFARREQDRVPRCDSFWPETITRWQREGLTGDYDEVMRRLGADFQSLCWCWPAPFPGRREVLSQDAETETVRDAWGGGGPAVHKNGGRVRTIDQVLFGGTIFPYGETPERPVIHILEVAPHSAFLGGAGDLWTSGLLALGKIL